MDASFVRSFRRHAVAAIAALLLLPANVFAQSPWERAASNLALTFTGPLKATLHVSTTGTDADWVLKLVDVYAGDFPNPEPNPAKTTMITAPIRIAPSMSAIASAHVGM